MSPEQIEYRNSLAHRLRWLADRWTQATPQRRLAIELAFTRGVERGA